MLSSLLRKAATDAGFDLELEKENGWYRLGRSGTSATVWVRPGPDGATLALPSGLASDLDDSEVAVTLPTGTVAATDYPSASALFHALRRLRVLIQTKPPQLERLLEEKLTRIGTTEREAIVRQRIGQALFREALVDYWDGRCAVTGLDAPDLLRASHIKPWKDSTDSERLDVHNGLLLAVHLDALFDRGFLTFDGVGVGILSSQIGRGAVTALGLTGVPLRLSRLAAGHRTYMAFHRERVFLGI